MATRLAISATRRAARGGAYDALLVLSFGGPDGPDDVMPFLRNVVAGRQVSDTRLQAVATHYQQLGGASPINAQNRALIEALRTRLEAAEIDLPIYWGNRNWHPLLVDALRDMQRDGVREALAFVTSPYSCYSCCRQYLEDIERARAQVGPAAPRVHKLRSFFNHPGYIAPNADALRDALATLPEPRAARAAVAFTAHSVPLSMARASAYVAQLLETARLVATAAGVSRWQLVYQSRSGPPRQAWLEPDLNDHLRGLARDGVGDVVVAPIGFISDHMEVVFDLDTEAAELAGALGVNLVRAATAGTHPRFIEMIHELIDERMRPLAPRLARGDLPPGHDVCPANCCRYVAA